LWEAGRKKKKNNTRKREPRGRNSSTVGGGGGGRDGGGRSVLSRREMGWGARTGPRARIGKGRRREGGSGKTQEAIAVVGPQ